MDGSNQAEQPQRLFRWLNFGSCLMRCAFDTPEFFKGTYRGLPLQVSKVWRREIGSLMSDWAVAEQLGIELPPSQFSEAWLSSKKIFQDADAILVDLALDIFQTQCLRFRTPGDGDFPPYARVISNFPEEVPPNLEAEVGVFPCGEDGSVQAWERFGHEIRTPTVFVTYENRDDIKSIYSPRFVRRLRDYQGAIAKLAEKFPHWLVISMDDLFAEFGLDCYIDGHHPTELGWKVLRERIPQIMIEKGLLDANPGGAPLPIGTKYVPERCDFGVLDLQHIARLSELNAETAAVGPPRLTSTAKSAFGSRLHCFGSFSALKNAKPPSLIIALKWDQPAKLPGWLTGLMKQQPGALIEIPCLWPDRDRRFLGAEELVLRKELRALGAANVNRAIDCGAVASERLLYAARCLLKTHRRSPGKSMLHPVQQTSATAEATPLPEALARTLANLELTPVFGAHS